jgi:hypothetical protein
MRMTGMSQDDLPSLPATVEELQRLVLNMHQQMETAQRETKDAQREAALQKQKNVELSATVASQKSNWTEANARFVNCWRLCEANSGSALIRISCCCLT